MTVSKVVSIPFRLRKKMFRKRKVVLTCWDMFASIVCKEGRRSTLSHSSSSVTTFLRQSSRPLFFFPRCRVFAGAMRHWTLVFHTTDSMHVLTDTVHKLPPCTSYLHFSTAMSPWRQSASKRNTAAPFAVFLGSAPASGHFNGRMHLWMSQCTYSLQCFFQRSNEVVDADLWQKFGFDGVGWRFYFSFSLWLSLRQVWHSCTNMSTLSCIQTLPVISAKKKINLSFYY